jgi:hypothetical protein
MSISHFGYTPDSLQGSPVPRLCDGNKAFTGPFEYIQCYSSTENEPTTTGEETAKAKDAAVL